MITYLKLFITIPSSHRLMICRALKMRMLLENKVMWNHYCWICSLLSSNFVSPLVAKMINQLKRPAMMQRKRRKKVLNSAFTKPSLSTCAWIMVVALTPNFDLSYKRGGKERWRAWHKARRRSRCEDPRHPCSSLRRRWIWKSTWEHHPPVHWQTDSSGVWQSSTVSQPYPLVIPIVM